MDEQTLKEYNKLNRALLEFFYNDLEKYNLHMNMKRLYEHPWEYFFNQLKGYFTSIRDIHPIFNMKYENEIKLWVKLNLKKSNPFPK